MLGHTMSTGPDRTGPDHGIPNRWCLRGGCEASGGVGMECMRRLCGVCVGVGWSLGVAWSGLVWPGLDWSGVVCIGLAWSGFAHPDSTQTPPRDHPDSTQTPHRLHTDCTQTPHRLHPLSTQTPPRVRTDSTQAPHRLDSDPMQTPRRLHTYTERLGTPRRRPPGPGLI